jgi:hypothetical protein
MSLDQRTQQLMQALRFPPFLNISRCCGNETKPGREDAPGWRCWADKETTDDQLSIEQQLEELVDASSSILHIGAGNSSLARRFAPRVASVLAITIYDQEHAVGESTGLSNYTILVQNKFARSFSALPLKFDFIVENNPSSYTCCLLHFSRMMVSYAQLLRDGGRILTAEPGLSWVCSGNNPNWSLTWPEWSRLGEILGELSL